MLGCSNQLTLAKQVKNHLVGKKNKNGTFDGESRNICNNIVDLKVATANQSTPKDCLSMHPSIGPHVQNRNSEPQYFNSSKECAFNAEYDAPYDHMLHLINSQKNTKHFGFSPKSALKIYEGQPVQWHQVPDILQAHRLIKDSNLPNFLHCRIPVQSGLNIKAWRSYLQNYWDQQLCDLLEFGFPIDFDRTCHLHSTEENHASAIENMQDIGTFLQEERQYEAILGPFDTKPIDMHVSPLLVRDKQNSTSKRTIMDLSWPKGASVNNGVAKDTYLGTPYELNYPSVDSITNSLRNLGPSAQIYKIDTSRAFRQIKIDPGDIDLLGIKFQDQYFLDRWVAFGFCHGSLIFQRCTDAIRYIMAQHGFPLLYNYIDDLIYTGLPSQINESFIFLKKLLGELGLEISNKKLVPSATSVTCLGILVDSVQKTISIPSEKLAEIVQLCADWGSKTYCSKKDLQSLLGSLLYVSRCVKHSRFFLNRMLQLLRDNVDTRKILITAEFKHDLAWFNSFLPHYNVVTYYDQS